MKKQELLKLAKLRQSTIYEGYKSISDYVNGYYECDYVSPYSKSAHNINADIFIILQDWSSDENMKDDICEETNRLGYTPTVQTNKNLINLLKEYLDLELKNTYATNLFPYIKMGGMSANIPAKDMCKAAKDFTLPMIDIIQPKIAIAFGRNTFDALRQTCNIKPKNIVNNSFMYKKTKIFYQAHPSQQAQNSRNRKSSVKEDWELMVDYLSHSV